MSDVLITPASASIDFANQDSNHMVITGSGEVEAAIEVSGSQSGQLFSVVDRITGTLFAVTDPVSMLPLFEVIDDQRVLFYGPLLGKQYFFTYHNYEAATAALFYIPMNSNSETAGIANVQAAWVAPADGQLIEIILHCASAPGLTIVGFHKNDNTTATETESITISGAGTPEVFPFGISTFKKGDKLHISVDPANIPGIVFVTCRWLYNLRT